MRESLKLYDDLVDNVGLRVAELAEIDSVRHQATRLPMCNECKICLRGKSTQPSSRRRPCSRMTAASADARERPFAGGVHKDHIVMGNGSVAACAAESVLVLTDERTEFKTAIPVRDRSTETIVGAIFILEGPDMPAPRWSDGSPEFAAAASGIIFQCGLCRFQLGHGRPVDRAWPCAYARGSRRAASGRNSAQSWR